MHGHSCLGVVLPIAKHWGMGRLGSGKGHEECLWLKGHRTASSLTLVEDLPLPCRDSPTGVPVRPQ